MLDIVISKIGVNKYVFINTIAYSIVYGKTKVLIFIIAA
jgi:hypothetical protein